MKRAIKIEDKDNVATSIENIFNNELVNIFDKNNELVKTVKADEIILTGNKISLENIKKDYDIIKYGHIIGKAICDITEGDLVGVHNIDSIYSPISETVRESVIHEYEKRVENE